MPKKSETTKFVVDLGGMKLPVDVERRIGIEIKRAVLSELAKLDFKGDLVIKPESKLPNRTIGFVVNRPPPIVDYFPDLTPKKAT